MATNFDEQAPTLALGPLLRYVDGTSATIWVETTHACDVTILGCTTQTFSVHGRHYALVIVEGLQPGNDYAYTVALGEQQVWPDAASTLPPSTIRTPARDTPVSVLLGSCRAAAPHEPPYTLELALNNEGRGVDSLWAHAKRMASEPVSEWPHLLLLVGDQIYADDSSPEAKERIKRTRPDGSDLPPEIVATYEEYCWLYHEAWSLPLERWLLSTVPSAMIFDDHDMIDDWNISASWVDDIRAEPWWQRHACDGLMSYWIYQHLGNLSPRQIRDEGMLEAIVESGDGTEILSRWADSTEACSSEAGGYRFSFSRIVGDVTVVVIDCRNARVLDENARLMVGPQDWSWIRDVALSASGHLLLATSVPVYIADGLHDLQLWNERVCQGAWGKRPAALGEKLRRGLDLEDWSAFAESYRQFSELTDELRMKDDGPASVVVASGDIHFSYAARLPPVTDQRVDVWQVVSSPIRNALIPPERGVMRATLTAAGTRIGDLLRRSVRSERTRPRIQMAAGPFFANNMCEIHYSTDGVELVIEQASPTSEGDPKLVEAARVPLVEKRGTSEAGGDA